MSDLPRWFLWPEGTCNEVVRSALREPFNDLRGAREAAELLQRLLRAGLSKYEPDPVAALERVEAEKRQPAK